MTSRVRLKAIAVAAALFLAGLVTGVGITRWAGVRRLERLTADGPRETSRRLLVWALERGLDLTPEQQDAIDRILAEESTGGILRTIEPQYAPVRARVTARVRAVLRPDQHAAYDALMSRREALYQRSLRDAHPGASH